jgi:glutamate-1-semialdehyde aminotransferase
MPISAIAGKRAIMEHMRPRRQSEMSGTYLAHLTTVLAALAALEVYGQPGFYERLDALGRHFYRGFQGLIDVGGAVARLQHAGPRFGLYFGIADEVTNYRHAARQDREVLLAFVAGCIRRGVYFHVATHHGFCAAHTEADLDRALEGIAGALEEL